MKTKYDTVQVTKNDAGILKVLKHQRKLADTVSGSLASTDTTLERAIADSEKLLKELGRPRPIECPRNSTPLVFSPVRSWAEILADAEKDVLTEVSVADLLTAGEIAGAEQSISALREEFDAEHRLDGIDWAICGVAGVMAALVDTFLVKMPSSAGLLGSEKTAGGPLSDFIRGRLRNAHTPEQIRDLEAKYGVPYDVAHSGKLAKKVSGLGPRTHRYQTLGHDPILGFLFGVYDILKGTITAIDSTGRIIVQAGNPATAGMSVFEALARQFGHLESDVSTPAGLPAPLMPLLQFIQVGSFGKGEATVGEISRLMYAKGYDFGHFLAMSIPVLLIEVLVRFAYCIKRLKEGHSLSKSLPMNLPGKPRQPKLQTMLFVAHLIATAANGGRVYLTGNPLAINYPQWVMFTKSSLQQAKWVLYEKENERLAHVQSHIDCDWGALNRDLSVWWNKADSSSVSPVRL